MANTKSRSLIVRNFTFGVEDSLVSTVGLLAGIAVAGVEQKTIVLTGLVLIFVEAFSMGIGSLLSEQSAEEYEAGREIPLSAPALAAVVMFFSYVIAGLIPLSPYMFSVERISIWWSVGLTLVSLFFLGYFNGRMFRIRAWRGGITTLLMGGLAIAVGIVVGQIAGGL